MKTLNYYSLEDLMYAVADTLIDHTPASVVSMVETFIHNEGAQVSMDNGSIVDSDDDYTTLEYVVYVNDTLFYILADCDKTTANIEHCHAFDKYSNVIM